MSRTSSRAGSSRGEVPPSRPVVVPASPKVAEAPKPAASTAANVRPSFSFASAAASKKDALQDEKEVDEVADEIANLEVS